ncbi:MAG: response regulator [Saprospiraceae bacterium]|nr:response regulator [Saprospiraceae bacterium]
MLNALLIKGNTWLTRLVAYPGDDEETLVIKKIWLSTGVAINLSAFTSSFWWFFGMGLRTIFIMEMVYVGFYSVLIALFLWLRRYTDWFVLATALFHIFFSFVGVCLHGGIIASAGLVFVGWGGGPVYLLLLQKNRKWATPVQLLFMVTVVVEVILQPTLSPDPNMSPDEAIILFTGFFLIITLAVFLMLQYSIGQNAKIKQAETARIRELAEMKSRFYTNITHEFRTPLTVILGMADQIEAKPADHFRSGLGLIRQNGNRLLHLVNQMLNLSKLEAGAMPVHYVQGDIVPYLLSVVEPYQRLAEGKNSRIQLVDWPDNLELDFDPEKLESLLGNLLSNAIKYTPKGSEIEVKVGVAEGDWEEDDSWFSLFGRGMPGIRWQFCVKDNGSGIAEGEINRIFDRFYQVDPKKNEEQTNHTQGTGIGLAVVKELLRLLGGNLFVKSVVGMGTEFRVYLPVTHVAKPTPAAISVSLPTPVEFDGEEENHSISEIFHKERLHILIVEDNSGVVQYLRSILADDYQIGVAVNGQEGIDKALETIPDLIISDVMMPQKDGFELCRTLKKDFRTSHIPIILLTAKADLESQLAGLEYGADAYLTKPFNSRELRTHVRKLIELRDALREKYRATSEPVTKVPAIAGPDDEFFHNLMNAVAAHSGDEEFHVVHLCHKLGISRVQLFRKLKALTGNSASQFVRSYRLNKAKGMLTNTDLNISEIAFEVGFKDPAYFTRAFTREFGVAPSAFRK